MPADERISPVRPTKAAGEDRNAGKPLFLRTGTDAAWSSYDPRRSQTADYPQGDREKYSDSADVQPLIDALTNDKKALEQLHLEGQLENAQLRRQVQEVADAFKETLHGIAPTECERCEQLMKELQTGYRDTAKLQGDLLDTATEAEAHKLRCEIFSKDAKETKERLQEVEKDYALLKKELPVLRSDNKELQELVQSGASELSNDRAVMLTELEMFRRQVGTLESMRNDAEHQLQASDARIASLEADKASLMTRLAGEEQALLAHPAAQSPHTPRHEAADVALHKQIAGLEAELGFLRQTNTNLEEKAQDMEQQYRQILSDKSTFQGELAALREVSTRTADEDSTQTHTLKEQLSAACQQRDALGTELGTIRRQMSSLSEQLQLLEQTRNALISEKSAAHAEAMKKTQECSDLQAELALTQERLKTTKGDNERLTAKIASLKDKNQRNATARDELVAVKERLRSTVSDKERAESERDEADMRSQQSECELLMSSQRIESMRIEMDAMDSQLHTVNSMETTLKGEIEQYQEQVTSLSSKLEGRVAELQREIAQQAEAHADVLDSTTSSMNSDLQEERRQAREAKEGFLERLRELELDLDKERSRLEIEKSVRESLNSSVSSLHQELSTERESKMSLETRVQSLMFKVQETTAVAESRAREEGKMIADLEGSVTSLQSDLDSAKENLALASSAQVALEGKVSVLETTTADDKERIASITSENQRLGEHATSLLRTKGEEEAKTQDRLEQLGKTLSLVQEELVLQKASVESLTAERDHLRTQLQSAAESERGHGATISSLQASLEDMHEEAEESLRLERERSVKLGAEKTEADDMFEGLRGDHEKLLKQKQDLELVHSALGQEMKSEKKKTEDLQKRATNAEASLGELQTANDVMEARLAAQRDEIQTLRDDIAGLHTTSQADVAKMREKLRVASAEAAQQTGKADAATALQKLTDHEHQEAQEAAKAQLDQALRDKAELQGRSESLAEQLNTAKRELAEALTARRTPNPSPSLAATEHQSHVSSRQGSRRTSTSPLGLARTDEVFEAEKAKFKEEQERKEGEVQRLHSELQRCVGERDRAVRDAAATREEADGLLRVAEEWRSYAGRVHSTTPTAPQPDPRMAHPQISPRRHTVSSNPTIEEARLMPMEESEVHRLTQELTRCIGERDRAVREVVATREEAESLSRAAEEWRQYASKVGAQEGAGVGVGVGVGMGIGDLSTLQQALSGQPFASLRDQLLQRCTSPTIPPSTAAFVQDCLSAYPTSPSSEMSSPYLARAASPSRLVHT